MRMMPQYFSGGYINSGESLFDFPTNALTGTSKNLEVTNKGLNTRKGFGEFMKDEIAGMEKDVFNTVISDVLRIHEAAARKKEGSPYSGKFISILTTKIPQEIDNGKPASQVVVDIMDSVMAQEESGEEISRIEDTAGAIIEELESIKLLDDTDDLIKSELPIIIVTESLDLYRALKLFDESPQMAGIVTDEDDPTAH